MPTSWDSVLVGALAGTLHRRLHRARVRAIHLDHEGRDLFLFLRDGVLLFRLHPHRGEVVLLPPAEPFDGSRPLPARVARVRALPDDRVLLLELRRVRGPGFRTLVVEWIPTRWNALLVEGRMGDPGDRTVRHVLVPRDHGRRPAVPGVPWLPPQPTRRPGARSLPSREEGELALGALREDESPRALAWVSPLNLRWLLQGSTEEAWNRWLLLRAAGTGGEVGPAARIPVADGWTPYPVALPGGAPVEGDLLDAFVACLQEAGGSDPGGLALIPPEWLDALAGQVQAAERRLRGLTRELDRTPDPVPIRSRGDLLLARLREVPRGATEVTLVDFDGTPLVVELDPSLPPQGNAARFYAEAARIERARAQLPERIRQARERAAELADLLEAARAGAADREEVLAALPAERPTRSSGEGGTSLPYRRYRTSGGIEVRVGRGSRHNDDLTFRHASPEDVWLHARGAAGAHVILRWRGPGNPPARDLEEAAVLAALHSKARTSGSVPVDWTLRRYVRKPRRSPPGQVAADRVRTLFVEPDPEAETRLRPQES